MKILTQNLSKIYKRKSAKDIEVLKDINIEINTGQKVSLVGPSGAGKSTLLHILGLMDRPTAGKVFIDDKDCFASDDNYMRQMRKDNIGFVFQFHYLLADFTVMENILIPVWKDKVAYLSKAKDLLGRLGLLDRQNHFPNELSGGEQQRAALARALINSPKILFADEPTGNLDRVTGAEIEKLMFEISDQFNVSLVLVTHNEELAAKSDTIIKMHNGGVK